MKKVTLFILLICTLKTAAQEIKFYGEAKPGSIIIGVGKDISAAWLDNKVLQVDKAAGAFVFGFDRDAEGKYKLKVKFKNKKIENYDYEFEAREYSEQSLHLANKFVTPPKKYRKQINAETAMMKSARAKMNNTKTAFYLSGFDYPVDSVHITGEFGNQRILNGKPKNIHNGIDFSAETGDSIYAISDGIVRLAGKKFYYNGNFVLLDHGQGLNSVYLHMSQLKVKNGDKVKKGDLLGLAGSTGRATGPHLHLGVQWFKKRIDPKNVLELKF